MNDLLFVLLDMTLEIMQRGAIQIENFGEKLIVDDIKLGSVYTDDGDEEAMVFMFYNGNEVFSCGFSEIVEVIKCD